MELEQKSGFVWLKGPHETLSQLKMPHEREIQLKTVRHEPRLGFVWLKTHAKVNLSSESHTKRNLSSSARTLSTDPVWRGVMSWIYVSCGISALTKYHPCLGSCEWPRSAGDGRHPIACNRVIILYSADRGLGNGGLACRSFGKHPFALPVVVEEEKAEVHEWLRLPFGDPEPRVCYPHPKAR